MAEETKTYVFGDGKQCGLDASSLLALMNNNGGFGGNNWMWVIFLFFLYGWGGNGFFGNRGGAGNGLANEINNDYGRSLLLQAINGNGNAISQLATTLNCDVNAIQTAINSVTASVANVSNQVGMSSQQVINAIQSGNQTLASQLASCCCENKQLVITQGYENRIANLEQTNVLGNRIDGVNAQIAAQTTFLSDKFCDLEKREMQNKIDALREAKSTLEAQISNANQTAQIQQYVAASVNPLAAGLAGLQTELASMKCKMPETTTIPYSPVVGVPACAAAQFGFGFPNGWNNGSIWG